MTNDKYNGLHLRIMDKPLTIHRFPAHHSIPPEVLSSEFFSISRTEEELSMVCDSSRALDSERSEPGWACIKVVGPLDFAWTGILAGLTGVLSQAGISVFAISTFDTDYILVKSNALSQAVDALAGHGYTFE